MTPEHRNERASRLREILDHDDIKAAWEAVEADLIAEWQQCREPAERENIWHAQRVLGLLRSKLASWKSHDLAALRRSK